MKCPKCGSETVTIERLDDNKYSPGESPYSHLCQKCGHEEKTNAESDRFGELVEDAENRERTSREVEKP